MPRFQEPAKGEWSVSKRHRAKEAQLASSLASKVLYWTFHFSSLSRLMFQHKPIALLYKIFNQILKSCENSTESVRDISSLSEGSPLHGNNPQTHMLDGFTAHSVWSVREHTRIHNLSPVWRTAFIHSFIHSSIHSFFPLWLIWIWIWMSNERSSVDEYNAHGGAARALGGRPQLSQEGVGAICAHSRLR